jgi:hypothetical protein
MAGIVAIYGLVVSVIISGKLKPGGPEYHVDSGFRYFMEDMYDKMQN